MASSQTQKIAQALRVAKEVSEIMVPLIEKHGPEVMEKAGKVKDDAKSAALNAKDSLGANINKFSENRRRSKEEKEQRQAAADARKRAVAKSLSATDAVDFAKSFELSIGDGSDMASGYLAISGCYAIATYKSSKEKDLTAYEDIFVGASDNIGVAVYSQFMGLGNVDVYADFKYKQPMKVLIYPQETDQIPALYRSLLDDLQALDSYNSRIDQ